MFKDSTIEFIGDINNSLGSASNAKNKFLKWAEDNNYQVEILEFSSFLEAGFSYRQVRRGHSCVKVILVDQHHNRKGAYLMTAFGYDTQVKFVPEEKIKFKNPIINSGEEKTNG